MSPIFFMKHLQLRFCFSLAPSIKLMTHLEPRHTNYSLLKKKRCGEVNRHRNTNNILLPLLFKIKSYLSISLKRSVLIRHTVGTTSGTKRYFPCYYENYEVLRDSSSYYKLYYVILPGITSHYEVLQVVRGGTAR